MSEPVYDIDERLWELYILSCKDDNTTPSIKDFMTWCEDQDYDLPDIWEKPDYTDVA